MVRVIIPGTPNGPLVELCVLRKRYGGRVGLIAQPAKGKGWTELTAIQACELADELIRAARESERAIEAGA